MTGAAAPVGRSSSVSAALLAVLGALALVHVVKRAWTCDDAFISYRYARHLVEGRGLVWNPGERVEAYTNPLFTLGLAAAMALGAEPRLASMAAGMVAYFAVAYLLSAWSRERTPTVRWWIPLGSALWLIQD